MVNNTTCCGLGEFSGLTYDPEVSMREIFEYCYVNATGHKRRFIVFTDPVVNKRGIKLAAYIRENGIGNVLETEALYNSNSHRNLQVFVLGFNDDGAKKWYDKMVKEASTREINGFKVGDQIQSIIHYNGLPAMTGICSFIYSNLEDITIKTGNKSYTYRASKFKKAV